MAEVPCPRSWEASSAGNTTVLAHAMRRLPPKASPILLQTSLVRQQPVEAFHLQQLDLVAPTYQHQVEVVHSWEADLAPLVRRH